MVARRRRAGVATIWLDVATTPRARRTHENDMQQLTDALRDAPRTKIRHEDARHETRAREMMHSMMADGR